MGSKWYYLGRELLENNKIAKLNAIQNNYRTDDDNCCRRMFDLWLETQPKASWKQLILALRQKEVKLPGLANKVEKRLSKSTGVYIHIN